MNQKSSFCLNLIFAAVFFTVFIFIQNSGISAQNVEDIKFPVAELGNCKDKKSCEIFCEKQENMLACVNFAESHGIMSKEEAEMARKMADLGIEKGPGGCRSEKECESYCENPDNMKECIVFAKEHNLMPPEELEEAEKVLNAFEKGAKTPGGCSNKEKCEKYCEDSSHTEECVVFAEAAGFMSPEEAAMVRKTGGKGPGGCRGKKECENYCEDQSHMKDCIIFASEHDLMPPEEKEQALKMLSALEKGIKMPNCKGKEDCDEYCSRPENSSECLAFAEAAGFITPEEAEMARKMAERGIMEGPGGCRSKEECENFCNNPDNMIACIEFAEKAGMMSHEEAEKVRSMGKVEMMGGPGGCKSQQECEEYCQSHTEECIKFSVENGMMDPQEAERAQKFQSFFERCGGGPEACERYCAENLSDSDCAEMMPRNHQEGEFRQEGEHIGPPNGMMNREMNPEMIREEITNQQIREIMESRGVSPDAMSPEAREIIEKCFQNPQDGSCGGMGGSMPPFNTDTHGEFRGEPIPAENHNQGNVQPIVPMPMQEGTQTQSQIPYRTEERPAPIESGIQQAPTTEIHESTTQYQTIPRLEPTNIIPIIDSNQQQTTPMPSIGEIQQSPSPQPTSEPTSFMNLIKSFLGALLIGL